MKNPCRIVFYAALAASPLATTAVAADEVVNIYSSRHYDVDDTVHKAFTAKTGIKVQHVQVKEASQLVERVKYEGAKSEADVIMTVDIGNLWRADDAGILAAEQVPGATRQISAELRHPDGKWYAVSTRARVIVYRKDKVQPSEIAGYEDLADPKWKGRLLVRSSNHVYNQSLVASFLHHIGPDRTAQWVAKISENLARKPEGGDTDQIKGVAAGIGDVAIVNSYYVARIMKSTKPEDQAVAAKIGVVFPNQKDRGTHINVSGVAIAKHAPHRANAIKFVEFLLTDEVQALYAEENGEYPVTKIALPRHLAVLGTFRPDTASLASIGAKTPEAVKIMDQSSWR